VINLFTSYYQCGDAIRQKEIDLCIHNNIDNPSIDKLIVFIDDGSELVTSNPKVHIINIDRRPTYLDWVNETKALGLEGVSILCNSDIHFDHNITRFEDCFESPKSFVVLSRWEVLTEGLELHPNPHWSQDVWAIHAKDADDKNLFSTLNFPMGIPRCDNKIAYQFGIYGWKVINPCEFIKSYHVHETGFRTYNKKLDDSLIGGVAYVHPSDTVSEASKLDFDVWVKNSSYIQKVQINKSLEKWIREAKEAGESVKPVQPSTSQIKPKPMANTSSRSDVAKVSPQKSKMKPLEFMQKGELIFQHAYRFRVYKFGDELMHIDNLSPKNHNLQSLGGVDLTPEELTQLNLKNWFPAVIDISPLDIRQRPTGPKDSQFWQYPCSTEEQAYRNHLKIKRGDNINHKRKTIDTYLALPWATYIDKKMMPERVMPIVKAKIQGLAKLAEHFGYKLHVHTVCQQIHWRRFISKFNELGITDLHISHMEVGIDARELDMDFDVHSWPLIAVNVETPERSKGLDFDKPLDERQYLASFIGAHMPHYRSDVRIKLYEAAKSSNREDVLIDLGNEWHFNKVVYQEQVMSKAITADDAKNHDDRTVNYNRIISNSVFSLCPEGAGPNTLRLWESMAVGSIPIVFADEWIPPNIPGGELKFEDCVISVKRQDIHKVFDEIDAMPMSQRKTLQENCVKAYAKYREVRAF